MSNNSKELIVDEQTVNSLNDDGTTQEQTSAAVSAELKYRKYSLKLKLEAVAYSKNHMIADAAKKYRCDRKRIRKWKQNEDKLREENESLSIGKKKMRFSGARRKEVSVNLNEAVLKWIEEARDNRQRVSRRLIKLQAKKSPPSW
uniref:Brinker DNA-binding domain-containing protein n=1 Tax=Plectus sambesii TaxID=2011161 RepID=A0A914VZK4_9BILA